MEKVTEQAQKAFNDGVNLIQEMAEENFKRMEGFMSEWQQAQQKSVTYAQQTLDEATKIAKQNMDYGVKMTAEMQKLAVATSKQAAEVFKNVKQG